MLCFASQTFCHCSRSRKTSQLFNILRSILENGCGSSPTYRTVDVFHSSTKLMARTKTFAAILVYLSPEKVEWNSDVAESYQWSHESNRVETQALRDISPSSQSHPIVFSESRQSQMMT